MGCARISSGRLRLLVEKQEEAYSLIADDNALNLVTPLPGGAMNENINSPYYIHYRDWLGSSRFVSVRGSRSMYFDTAYAPFGESYASAGTSDLNFTGQRQDISSGDYDFAFREYNRAHGRWMSPDPAGTMAVDPVDPQSWNRYAYVQNDPLRVVDPLGLCDGDRCPTIVEVRDDPDDPIYNPADLEWVCSGGGTVLWDGVDATFYFCHPVGGKLPISHGGESGKPPAANNGAQSPPQQCLNQVYNSVPGKAIQFFSLVQMIPGFGQDPLISSAENVVGLGSKAVVVQHAAENAG